LSFTLDFSCAPPQGIQFFVTFFFVSSVFFYPLWPSPAPSVRTVLPPIFAPSSPLLSGVYTSSNYSFHPPSEIVLFPSSLVYVPALTFFQPLHAPPSQEPALSRRTKSPQRPSLTFSSHFSRLPPIFFLANQEKSSPLPLCPRYLPFQEALASFAALAIAFSTIQDFSASIPSPMIPDGEPIFVLLHNWRAIPDFTVTSHLPSPFSSTCQRPPSLSPKYWSLCLLGFSGPPFSLVPGHVTLAPSLFFRRNVRGSRSLLRTLSPLGPLSDILLFPERVFLPYPPASTFVDYAGAKKVLSLFRFNCAFFFLHYLEPGQYQLDSFSRNRDGPAPSKGPATFILPRVIFAHSLREGHSSTHSLNNIPD